MTVTETLMGNGTFDLSLKPDARRKIAHLLRAAPYGLVKIYPQRIDPQQVDGIAPLYVGVLNRSPTLGQAGGVGLGYFLGEDGNDHSSFTDSGPLLIPSTGGTWDLATWVAAVISAGTLPFTAGVVSAADDGTHPNEWAWRTPRAILDWIASAFATKWRVNSDFTLDVTDTIGTAAPTVIATPGGGRDGKLFGIDATVVAPAVDLSTYATLAVVKKVDPDTGAASFVFYGGSSPYLTPAGDVMGPYRTAEGDSDEARKLGLEVLDTRELFAPFSFDCDEYAVTDRLRPGDQVWLDVGTDDPYATGITGLTQLESIEFRGRRISPIRLPVSSITWPIQQGMSVFLDNRHNPVFGIGLVDLTDHMAWEDGSTTVNVGAPPFGLRSVLRGNR